RAFSGRSANRRAPRVGVDQPGHDSYTGWHTASSALSEGNSVMVREPKRYEVQISMRSRPSSTSSFVSASASSPLMRTPYRTATASYQPQRRGRPVTAPYSFPMSRSRLPMSPASSVGSGPSPTRVVYAFATPITAPMARGPMPRPVQTPPIDAFDEVTYG